MKLDLKAIQAELDSLVNPMLTDNSGQPVARPKDAYMKVIVKADLKMSSKVGIDETVNGYTIRLYRPRIRNQGQLDSVLAWVRKEIKREQGGAYNG